MTEAHLREASRMVDLFSDPLRLRMIGKLVESSWTVAALAAELKVKPRSVARHIRNLDEAGLVLHSDDRPTEYRFATERLRRIAAELRPDTPDEFEDSVSGDAIVLRRFVSDGQLARLPSQRNRWLIILRWLAERFEAGRDYPESEVNEILGAVHEDYALLRRQLVDEGFLARDHGVYWRVESSASGGG